MFDVTVFGPDQYCHIAVETLDEAISYIRERDMDCGAEVIDTTTDRVVYNEHPTPQWA